MIKFDTQFHKTTPKVAGDLEHDLSRKLAVILAFDFEASCQLKAWDDLGEIVLRARVCNSIQAYELMADCVLSSPAPTQCEFFPITIGGFADLHKP